MNALIGQKISIISNKAQTTRHRVLGILNEKDGKRTLVLYNGKFLNTNNKKTTIFDFDATEVDLTKYTTKSITHPKIQEKNTLMLFRLRISSCRLVIGRMILRIYPTKANEEVRTVTSPTSAPINNGSKRCGVIWPRSILPTPCWVMFWMLLIKDPTPRIPSLCCGPITVGIWARNNIGRNLPRGVFAPVCP